MKGIIFNLLEQVISDEYGPAAWDNILDTTGLDGAYTAVGSYEDPEFLSLVGAASEVVGKPQDEVVKWFGRACLPLLAERYSGFFAPHTSTRSFLLTLNDVIHPEVRKLFPGAYAPSFEFDDTAEDELTMSYESHRNLCSFAEGLIEGAAAHFGEEASIEQPRCSKRGDESCVLVTSFRPKR